MRVFTFTLTFFVLLVLSACGGSGSGGNGNLSTAVGVPLSTYVVIEIATGKVEAYSSLSDLDTNDKYKTTHLVFRTLDASSAYYGQDSAGFGFQADETEGMSSVDKYFIGVFEVTQAQWENMTGATPWTSIDASAIGMPTWSVASAQKPASNLSYDSVMTALSTYNSGKSFSLSLPSDIQWEHACRANGTDVFSWGASMNTAVAGQYAVIRETFGGSDGPEIVGEQTANGYGLYDCHGNVWEITSGQNIRGGSWYDNITQARCANKHSILEDVEHYLVGVRLVFNP